MKDTAEVYKVIHECWVCPVCGTEYEGPKAKERAQACAEKGMPEHLFERGASWEFKVLGKSGLTEKWKIVDLTARRQGSGHTPTYRVAITQRGNEEPTFLVTKTENEIRRMFKNKLV